MPARQVLVTGLEATSVVSLIALIVVALNALAQWVRSKVSMTKIVDDYWCYIQPVAEAVRAAHPYEAPAFDFVRIK